MSTQSLPSPRKKKTKTQNFLRQKNQKQYSEEEQKKKEQKEKNTREALALGMQIFSFATEKADTRNWQSLPHTIYYTRVPLQKGTNMATLQLSGSSFSSVQLSVEGNGSLQFQNVCTMR